MHLSRVVGVLLVQHLLLLALYGDSAKAQQPRQNNGAAEQMLYGTDSAGTDRFVAAHGRKAVIMGYPAGGLEIWGYPFQILSGYQVAFKASGATAETDGRLLLRRVDYRSDSVTRIYIGPDYLVREKLFVPLDEAAVVISYEVEGLGPLEISIHFQPVLDLMWPGALGGQYTRWSEAAAGSGAVPGFVLSEPLRGYSAAIGSPEIISHDGTVNSTVRPDTRMSFALRPSASSGGDRSAVATVYVALNAPGTKDAADALQRLASGLRHMEAEAATHYAELEASSLRIRTPDEEVNRSFAWTVAALDQAWVCNSLLGCGIVAGYGPSRDARRPQYAWFFGGDGLFATNALVSAGEYSRAREELAFIQKYQDPATGMIWHELSQSAGLIDWSKFPYMFVHVDISFDYLATLARYVAVSGDTAFAKDHWASIAAAYRYCQSSIQSGDHLPHIPADKEASDEQHRPADDLGLSASWIAAASGFAELAKVSGHAQQGEAALREAELTRRSIAAHYWNADRNFWFDGHTQSGEPIFRQATGPTQLLVQSVFSPQQNKTMLDQLASTDFQADWGMREVATGSKDYNPYSYGAGSVSALSALAATTFWQAHRPATAYALWRAVMQWSDFDSLGHLHEVLAGNFYHEQTESVPEQTWSSAALLDATVRGLLGLEVDGIGNRLRFAPNLPAEWHEVSVANIRMPHSVLALTMKQSMTAVDLEISNDGTSTVMAFEPGIPLGAHLLGAECQGHAVDAKTEVSPGDEHAKLAIDIPAGASRCHLSFEGGVSMVLNPSRLRTGDPSSDLKIIAATLQGQVLSIEVDVQPSGNRTFRIRTPWRITAQQGATVRPRSGSDDEYEIEMHRDSGPPPTGSGYVRMRAELTFASK